MCTQEQKMCVPLRDGKELCCFPTVKMFMWPTTTLISPCTSAVQYPLIYIGMITFPLCLIPSKFFRPYRFGDSHKSGSELESDYERFLNGTRFKSWMTFFRFDSRKQTITLDVGGRWKWDGNVMDPHHTFWPFLTHKYHYRSWHSAKYK